VTLPQFDAGKQNFDSNALSNYLLQSDRLYVGDSVCVSHVDYGGDSFAVMQYGKKTALMKDVKRRSSLQTKVKRKKPKTTTDTSDSDDSFKEYDEGEDIDDGNQHADIDDEDEDDGDENADKDKNADEPDDGDDGEEDNTDEDASEVDNEVYETILWDRGGELFFVIKVARIIAIADNHYPGFMLNRKQMNDAPQHAMHVSRTAKSMSKDIEDIKYI
jgi:hypothetical protein